MRQWAVFSLVGKKAPLKTCHVFFLYWKRPLTYFSAVWACYCYFYTCAFLSVIHAEARANWEKQSAAHSAWCCLLDANFWFITSEFHRAALRVFPRQKRFSFILRYLSHLDRKQIEFLSSSHFNSCQERNIKDSRHLQAYPLPCGFHICLAQWHSVNGDAARLNVFDGSKPSAGNQVCDTTGCVGVLVVGWASMQSFRLV